MHSPDVQTVEVDNERSTKRRRVKTSRYDVEFMDNEEQMMLQQVRPVKINPELWSTHVQCDQPLLRSLPHAVYP